MTNCPSDRARRWQREGTELLLVESLSLDEAALAGPSGLPGWNRRLLLAHVAANADALRNLTRWAATGEERPMYASPQARAAGLERGSRLCSSDLLAWLRVSARDLESAMTALTDEQWAAPVVTAQGRTVPATQTVWMRAREVYVHSVDLGTGLTFSDLPEDYLSSLREDILARRRRAGESLPAVVGPDAEVTAYLAGRPYKDVNLDDGGPAPVLGPWL